ncbi:MAG: hypothetical protein AABZ31_09950 [Bdellovibrionota bacterium]
MFKKYLGLMGLVLFASAAQAKQLGVGLILISPTGLSTNYFLDKNTSIDTAWAWSMNDDDQNLYVHATYLFHRPRLIKLDRTALDVHFGGGLRMISWDDRPGRNKKHDDETYLGLRGAMGLSYTFKPSVEVFSEVSMTMDVIPETDADVDIAIGARFYF